MRLNVPDIAALNDARTILLIGMGGGYDIFCGLPLRYALQEIGKTVHLANLSFTALKFIKNAEILAPGVYGIKTDCRTVLQYAPELHLAQHLSETVWCIGEIEVATQPVLRAFHALIAHLSPDAVVFVDGGVDSLMRGDEPEVGTLFEDAVSLSAAFQLPASLPTVLVCLGLGAENDISYPHVWENIAALTKDGGFLGACALTPQMEAYRAYETAVEFVHAQKFQEPSVINASVVSSVRGHFGDHHATERTKRSRLSISPQMGLYWFFDLRTVANRSLVITQIAYSETRREALQGLALVRSGGATATVKPGKPASHSHS